MSFVIRAHLKSSNTKENLSFLRKRSEEDEFYNMQINIKLDINSSFLDDTMKILINKYLQIIL